MIKDEYDEAATTEHEEVHAHQATKHLEAQELLKRAANLIKSLSDNDEKDELSDEQNIATNIGTLASELETLSCRQIERPSQSKMESNFEIADNDRRVWGIEDDTDDNITINEEIIEDEEEGSLNTAAKAAGDEGLASAAKHYTAPKSIVTPATFTIEYAPAMRPIKGIINLCIIVLGWKNKNNLPSIGDAASMGRTIASTYKKLSRDQLIFKVDAKLVAVSYNFAQKNLNKAEKQAKQKVKDKPYDMFAIINGGVKGYSNAGGNTAHLSGASDSTGLHEIGHILTPKIGLGHAGRYVGGKLEAYGDGTSFMSGFSSTRLTAPQLYHLGWLEEKEVAQHRVDSPTIEYEIEPLYADKNDKGYVKAIRIPREPNREIFLSVVPLQGELKFLAHYRTGGGSQRFKIFNQQAEIDDGLVLERVAMHGDHSTLRIGLRP